MKKKWLKLKKVILTLGIFSNIPFLVSCNSKETSLDSKTNEVVESETEEDTTSITTTTTSTPTTTTRASKETTTTSGCQEKTINENETIEYFNKADNEIDDLLTKLDEANVKEEIFAKFIKLTDFIFCDGEINGVRFNDLSDMTKQKVKEIHSKIDSKIDNKIPGYKNTLKDKYSQIKTYIENSDFVNKTKDKYNDFKEDAKDKVDEAVGHENTVDEFWDSVEEDYEDVKDMAETAKQKIKEKYNNWSEQYRK